MDKVCEFCDYLFVKKNLGEVTVDGYKRVLTKTLNSFGTPEPEVERIERLLANIGEASIRILTLEIQARFWVDI